jgi:hypothetical protein
MTIQPFRFWNFLFEHYIRNSKKRKASFFNMKERMHQQLQKIISV